MMSLGQQPIDRRLRNVADVPMRLALGSSMLYHGLAKLRAEGRAQTGSWFESIGLTPGAAIATVTGAVETFAGIAAILGIATRPAALAVIVTQAVAASKVHAAKGFDNTKGGMEYNLALISMALGLLVAGAGPISTSQLARTAIARRRKPNARMPVPALARLGRRSGLERGLALIH